MFESIGIILCLAGAIFVGLCYISARRDLARRHRELEQSLRDSEGGAQ